jgi:hypothetical protein
MKGLRIELAGKSLDLVGIDLAGRAGEALPDLEVFEIKFVHPVSL